MSHRKRFPPCPHCEYQGGDTRQTTVFSANDGEVPGWDVKCGWCGKHYLVAMFALPVGASMSALDEDLRERRRNDARRRFGYQVGEMWSSRGAKRFDSDRLSVKIRILPGPVAEGLAKRIVGKTRPVLIGKRPCSACKLRPVTNDLTSYCSECRAARYQKESVA